VNAETEVSSETMHSDERIAHSRDVEHLVVALMERAGPTEALMAGPEVVLAFTVGGVHYLLIRSDGPPAVAILSPRERQIARMVGKGLTNKSIAHMLDISPWTVSTHLRRIFTKLSVTNRAAMVTRLLTWKPVTQEPPWNEAFMTIQDLRSDQNGARSGAL
jgi:DNA-binding CsgD family transcriptional regulator